MRQRVSFPTPIMRYRRSPGRQMLATKWSRRLTRICPGYAGQVGTSNTAKSELVLRNCSSARASLPRMIWPHSWED